MKLSDLYETRDTKHRELSQLINPNLSRLSQLYSRNGHELRIVGGAVRDIMSGSKPKDIDLASDATPQETISLLKSAGIKVIETGLKHGTITANIDGEDYEITTLRIDRETDGRHAKVEFTRDWEKDAERRDLTFNAMSMDFDGNLYDYFGGNSDLKSGTAKFVGDAAMRMQEDYLRILRYFRFQGRMDSPRFDGDTLSKIRENVQGLSRISGERIWSEMQKILTGKNMNTVLRKMQAVDVLDAIGLSAPTSEVSRVKRQTNDKNLLLAAMIRTEDDLERLRGRWKFSNPEYKKMKFVIRNRGKNYSIEDIKRMVAVERVPREMLAALLEYEGDRSKLGQLNKWSTPTFPVTGDDLKAKGMTPGPEMGRALAGLRRQWADGGYSDSKDELLARLNSDGRASRR